MMLGRIHAMTQFFDSWRPRASDERDDRPDFPIIELLTKAAHIGFVIRRDERLHTVLDHVKELSFGVFPGVTAGVMGRGGQAAVGSAMPPVRLTLEIGAMTGGTMLHVDRTTQGDLLIVGGIGTGPWRSVRP